MTAILILMARGKQGDSRGHVFLKDEMYNFHTTLKRWHSMGMGSLNQIVECREAATDNEDSMTFMIQPMGVTVKYTRSITERRVSKAFGIIGRVDERISFKGLDAPERYIRNSFILSESVGDIVEVSDDPLMASVDNTDPDDIASSMMRHYLDVCFEQSAAAMEKEGVLSLPGEIMAGVKGVRRKLNLSQVDRFNDADGHPYTATTFEDMVFPALMNSYYQISCVAYDRFFILEHDFLVDCGGSSLLEAIVAGAKGKSKELDFSLDSRSGTKRDSEVSDSGLDQTFRFRDSYYAHRGEMDVYEHENDFIYLLEGLFPKEGSVYVYTSKPEIVERIFKYAFNRSAKEHTRIQDGGWLVFEDRNLKIHFLGDAADAEFSKLKDELYEQKRVELKKGRQVSDLLD